MNALEIWLLCKEKGLTFQELAIIEFVKQNPGTMASTVASALDIHYVRASKIMKELVQKEQLQSTQESVPRAHKTYKVYQA